ncbi:aminoglycoside N(3)-acetyltransferase [Streptomyces alboflavus]|uniref:aminoglycoside N(3)-acetyltransferase n=1 Tax=Streptomyces alboflavus TaxID=67267 RepID=UPI0004BF4F3C|nr:AAC(3) family N-acetyltransferase [Streptomyces alboflavus]
MPTPPPTGPLCTRESIADELRALGVGHGETLLVHTSLSSLGWVSGGAEAVVLALFDCLGDEGTLVVPSQSSDNSDPAEWEDPPVPASWWPAIRATMPAYDPRTARTRGVGVLPETVRTWPGAVRSAHPQTSFAAVGPHAKALMDGHALDCRLGEHSPLARLEAAGARVLLLGAGFGACTAFHLAEYRLPAPGPLVENSFAVMTDEGRRWMTVRETDIDEERFDELGADFERERSVVRGTVGAATARLFPLADAVAYAQAWLPKHRPGGGVP